MMFLSNFANLFFYSKFFVFSVINYADQKRNKSWPKMESVKFVSAMFFYIFMIFYWVFIKRNAI